MSTRSFANRVVAGARCNHASSRVYSCLLELAQAAERSRKTDAAKSRTSTEHEKSERTGEFYATLLDEGLYLGSIATMYRVLRQRLGRGIRRTASTAMWPAAR
jgi:hypothetical protein